MGELKTNGIFVIPRSSFDWKGNEAGWITASGWASAGEKLWGNVIVATSDGIFKPSESIHFPRYSSKNEQPENSSKNVLRKWIPEILITLLKDLKLYIKSLQVSPIENIKIDPGKMKLVWERHDIFPGAGRRIANKLNVPLVVSVEAIVVWEARKWGINRPLWGALLEKYSESRSLKKADLVVCVSEELKEKITSMGINPSKVLVSPNKVNPEIFNPDVKGDKIRNRYNLVDKWVLGWIGSFRGFHGLKELLYTFKEISRYHQTMVLMMVGDGIQFSEIKELAFKLGIEDKVIFPGRKPISEIPEYISSFDLALVTAASTKNFHYSPLKLQEYLACRRAVIAPKAGDLPKLFTENKEVVFYDPDDSGDLGAKIIELKDNKVLKDRLEQEATNYFLEQGSWESELEKVCSELNI